MSTLERCQRIFACDYQPGEMESALKSFKSQRRLVQPTIVG